MISIKAQGTNANLSRALRRVETRKKPLFASPKVRNRRKKVANKRESPTVICRPQSFLHQGWGLSLHKRSRSARRVVVIFPCRDPQKGVPANLFGNFSSDNRRNGLSREKKKQKQNRVGVFKFANVHGRREVPFPRSKPAKGGSCEFIRQISRAKIAETAFCEKKKKKKLFKDHHRWNIVVRVRLCFSTHHHHHYPHNYAPTAY